MPQGGGQEKEAGGGELGLLLQCDVHDVMPRLGCCALPCMRTCTASPVPVSGMTADRALSSRSWGCRRQ